MTKEEIKNRLKEISELYKLVKANAKRVYLDPIDFPPETKERLRRLSRERVKLKEILNGYSKIVS